LHSNEKSMNKYIHIGTWGVMISLFIGLWITIGKYRDIKAKWNNASETIKAYSDQFSNSEKQNRAFKLTIDQLESSKDSIFQKLDEVRKELKVKDSKLKSLQYVSSSFARNDTIVLRDTLFKDSQVNVDTTLSDGWYSVRVGLRYPSTVAVKPEFKSEKYIVVSTKRETVNPPKKFFLWRWLQKKQTVLNIDVVEKNPYVQNQTNRYVEIVRQY